jgi:hypothetical protein
MVGGELGQVMIMRCRVTSLGVEQQSELSTNEMNPTTGFFEGLFESFLIVTASSLKHC